MRVLKASVIIMGVLIVIGTVVLVIGIINRSGRLASDTPTTVVDAGKALNLPLGLPTGSTLEQATPGERGVVLRVAVPGEGTVIFIVPWSGRGRIVRITLGSGPAKTPKGAPTKP